MKLHHIAGASLAAAALLACGTQAQAGTGTPAEASVIEGRSLSDPVSCGVSTTATQAAVTACAAS
ncbi:hypothetical protein [Streptomyces tsukubensis]|uniref:Chaplin n=1 Tax=Streptomyces tsukubensis TaxID=83656 RepID=A0A1V4A3D7_9ACTN|nr:hypothetical protein [Streptomyces tsukubensis]OON73868.1 hypothetical protein B1H18_26810 [Streptomyces tsukubensis]QFR91759.1 hypothetical protein GBW32_00215 [Streptomyces tsukubensis]